MGKDLFFVSFVKRGIAMLLLTATITTVQAKFADIENVLGIKYSVCSADEDEDDEIYFGPSIPKQ